MNTPATTPTASPMTPTEGKAWVFGDNIDTDVIIPARYLMTTDPEQADRVANQIDAGMVYVNIVGADSAELPFGGTKRSGFGRELGVYGADEFVNKKLIRVS